MQLVDARDGSPRPASDVIDDHFAVALERLSRKLEGATAKQKNPHPHGSLAFVAWIAARLGGWNCYYGKPGPKTMLVGWTQLATTLAGYALAPHGQNPVNPVAGGRGVSVHSAFHEQLWSLFFLEHAEYYVNSL
jgi:hypothetical protein